MITGVHTMFYTADAVGLNAFFRDKLGLQVSNTGRKLVFDLPEAELDCQPSDNTGENGPLSGTHVISFYCDNIHTTADHLKSKGVIFKGEIEDHADRFITFFKVPGDFYIQLSQLKYK